MARWTADEHRRMYELAALLEQTLALEPPCCEPGDYVFGAAPEGDVTIDDSDPDNVLVTVRIPCWQFEVR